MGWPEEMMVMEEHSRRGGRGGADVADQYTLRERSDGALRLRKEGSKSDGALHQTWVCDGAWDFVLIVGFEF